MASEIKRRLKVLGYPIVRNVGAALSDRCFSVQQSTRSNHPSFSNGSAERKCYGFIGWEQCYSVVLPLVLFNPNIWHSCVHGCKRETITPTFTETVNTPAWVPGILGMRRLAVESGREHLKSTIGLSVLVIWVTETHGYPFWQVSSLRPSFFEWEH